MGSMIFMPYWAYDIREKYEEQCESVKEFVSEVIEKCEMPLINKQDIPIISRAWWVAMATLGNDGIFSADGAEKRLETIANSTMVNKAILIPVAAYLHDKFPEAIENNDTQSASLTLFGALLAVYNIVTLRRFLECNLRMPDKDTLDAIYDIGCTAITDGMCAAEENSIDRQEFYDIANNAAGIGTDTES